MHEGQDARSLRPVSTTRPASCATGTCPAAHYLESWSDGRAYDGTVSIMQPLIAPLYEGHSAHEIIALLHRRRRKSGARSGARLLAEPAPGEGQGVRSVLGDFAARRPDGRHGAARRFPSRCARISCSKQPAAQAAMPSALEIVFRPDPTIGDGEYANNGWLQETAQARHAAHLGQRRDDQPGNRAAARA